MDEQELIRKVQEGDEMAFTGIVRIYKDKITNFLWQLTGDYQRAAELAQETFMRVYFKAGRYRPIAPVSSWIYAIASNLARTDFKKSRRYTNVPLEDVEYSLSSSVPFAENPDNSDLIKSLRKALDALHPRYRIPLVLKDLEGYSQEEIAEILNKPVGTIKARISRARGYLKREMEHSSISWELARNEE